MTTLPNMSLVLPTPGGSSGTWDDLLNAIFGLLDAHSHATGSGVLIRPAAIGINGDLTFAGFSPTNLRSLVFAEGQAVTGVRRIYVGADGELYWNSNVGTAVKLTDGTTLNMSFVGGIGGDYAAVSAALDYDDSNLRYTLKQGGGTLWARMASGEVRVYETSSTDTVYCGIAAPAALAVSYTRTLALALPGSTQLAQMSAAGVETFSNTVANLITASGGVSTPTISGTPNFTDAVTMASTLGVTGLITATAGVTCAANQHVTTSGTGTVKHGEETFSIGLGGAMVPTGTLTTGDFGTGPPLAYRWRLSDPGALAIAITGLRVGDRIKAIGIQGTSAGDGTVVITRQNYTTAVDHAFSSVGAFNTTGRKDCTLTVAPTLAADEIIWVSITAAGALIDLTHIEVTRDRP
jgi:hypothetical protein